MGNSESSAVRILGSLARSEEEEAWAFAFRGSAVRTLTPG